MARRYSILRKKVEELESDLGRLLNHHSANTAISQPYDYYEDFYKAIHGKFVFARRLMSAEMVSAHKQPLHLHDIEQRIAVLEATFLCWADAFFACSCDCSNEEADMTSSDDFGSVLDEDEDEEKNQEIVSWEDFLGDHVEDSEEEEALETFSCEEVLAATQEGAIVVKRERRDGKWCWNGKSLTSGLVFAVLVGVVSLVIASVSFYRQSHHHLEKVFLVPT